MNEVVYEDVYHPGYSIKASVWTYTRTVFLEVYDQGRGCQAWAADVDVDSVNEGEGARANSKRLDLKFDWLVSDRFDAELE